MVHIFQQNHHTRVKCSSHLKLCDKSDEHFQLCTTATITDGFERIFLSINYRFCGCKQVHHVRHVFTMLPGGTVCAAHQGKTLCERLYLQKAVCFDSSQSCSHVLFAKRFPGNPSKQARLVHSFANCTIINFNIYI